MNENENLENEENKIKCPNCGHEFKIEIYICAVCGGPCIAKFCSKRCEELYEKLK